MVSLTGKEFTAAGKLHVSFVGEVGATVRHITIDYKRPN